MTRSSSQSGINRRKFNKSNGTSDSTMDPPKSKHWGFSHLIIATGSTLLLMQIGSFYGWSSPFVARLMNGHLNFRVTDAEGSFIASLLNLGRVFGAIIGAVNSQCFGTRLTVFSIFIPIILGWLLMFGATSATWLYVSRMLSGLALGMTYASLAIFVGEVSRPSSRGAIISIAFVGVSVSATITSYLGKFLTLRMFSLCYTIPAIIGLVIFFYLPDSPQYLVRRGRIASAEKSLLWYRDGEAVDQELDDVKQYMSLSGSKTFLENIREFREPYVRKAFLLVVLLFVFEQGCGMNAVVFFLENILKKAQFHLMEPATVVVCMNILSIVFGLIAVTMIDRYGRKALLIAANSGMTLVMIALGTHFLLLRYGINPEFLQLVPIAAVSVFYASMTFGINPAPSSVQAEILPPSVKSVASCFIAMTSGLVGFFISSTYNFLVRSIGEPLVYFSYGLIALTAIPFVIIYLPETKGKSLLQIQKELLKKSNVTEVVET